MAKVRKRKRARKGKGILILILLLLIALVCVCLFAPFFNITSVEVSGNAQVTTEEILDRVNLVMGTNLFKINKRSLTKGLSTLSYLDQIKIRRKLPSTVKIEVTECEAELMFPHLTGWTLTTAEGKVLEEISDNTGWEIPLIRGVEIEEAQVCGQIKAKDEVKYKIVQECIRYLKSCDQLPLIRKMDFSDITNIWVFYKEGYRVNFAKLEDMDYKMKMLSAILPQIDHSEGTYIDLTTPSKVFTGKKEEEEESVGEEVQAAESEAPAEESPNAEGSPDAKAEESGSPSPSPEASASPTEKSGNETKE